MTTVNTNNLPDTNETVIASTISAALQTIQHGQIEWLEEQIAMCEQAIFENIRTHTSRDIISFQTTLRILRSLAAAHLKANLSR